MKEKLIHCILSIAGIVLLSACSGSISDEPDNSTKGSGDSQISIGALTRQQQLQDEFLDGKNGILLSKAKFDGDTSFTYSYSALMSCLRSLHAPEDPMNPDVLWGLPSPYMPLFPMVIKGCEPIVPFLGDYYDSVNYNETPYPLVADGGDILFPSLLIKDGVLSLEDYQITDIYVQVDGSTVNHDSQPDFGYINDCNDSDFLKFVNDGGSIKEICIKENKSDKPRTFWVKFYNPSSKCVRDNGSSTIYIQIKQEAAE